ncbi:hypothetical protein Pla52o_25250 [Novipirellula galeiformis]|uniref:Glycosyl transferase family 2 n=1 Tax=Novipirellula galeiformis TaxID=2528004 RepID=A0A5C6CI37_9BACT|nr:glycosyltransferase family 2 protein [Novipirellula galeiformis]TWU22991.1 hypothetical protein Pla52o_25250 [Novipirellula galeiformis]
MPNISPIPRLTIVVPVTEDLQSFETSLISVLEHQPSGCEVIVAHDGTYEDPFDLGDEVHFVSADSAETLELIAASASVARGRFVHVLSGGFKATEGWVDAALEKFEHHDVAAIAAVVRDESEGAIAGAGWFDSATRLCQPVGASQTKLDRRGVAKTDGVFIEASFWRRDVLRNACHCYRGSDLLEFSYASGLAVKQAGWRCVTAEQSELTSDRQHPQWNDASFRRGQRLWAIRQTACKDRSSFKDGFRALLGNLARPSRIGESIGQMAGSFAATEMKRRIHIDEITPMEEGEAILSMPSRSFSPARRAA